MEAKADLVAAMKGSIAECDRAFAGLTDAALLRVSIGGAGEPKSLMSSLWGMVARDSEGYGSLALHLRLRGIEPPDSNGTLAQ